MWRVALGRAAAYGNGELSMQGADMGRVTTKGAGQGAPSSIHRAQGRGR